MACEPPLLVWHTSVLDLHDAAHAPGRELAQPCEDDAEVVDALADDAAAQQVLEQRVVALVLEAHLLVRARAALEPPHTLARRVALRTPRTRERLDDLRMKGVAQRGGARHQRLERLAAHAGLLGGRGGLHRGGAERVALELREAEARKGLVESAKGWWDASMMSPGASMMNPGENMMRERACVSPVVQAAKQLCGEPVEAARGV